MGAFDCVDLQFNSLAYQDLQSAFLLNDLQINLSFFVVAVDELFSLTPYLGS
jgi:hypothetical protein